MKARLDPLALLFGLFFLLCLFLLACSFVWGTWLSSATMFFSAITGLCATLSRLLSLDTDRIMRGEE